MKKKPFSIAIAAGALILAGACVCGPPHHRGGCPGSGPPCRCCQKPCSQVEGAAEKPCEKPCAPPAGEKTPQP